MPVEDLRSNRMMSHLMNALEHGKDIGHYGRLVFAMVAHYFMGNDYLVSWLRKDPDFSEEQARTLVKQVKSRGYNPPRREKILEWQARQTFPILPDADDPDAGNVYKDLKFPDGVYHHIEEYYEQKAEAEAIHDQHAAR